MPSINHIGLGIHKSSGIRYWKPQYLAVKAAMSTPPSEADAIIQNRWVKDLLPVWDKAIVLDVLCTHSRQSSLLNWKNPGTFNPSNGAGAPTFTNYKGFQSVYAGSYSIRTNFTPSTDGAGFLGKDDITVIIATNTETNGDGAVSIDFGSWINTKDISINSAYGGWFYPKLNSDVDPAPGSSCISKRYFGLSRKNATEVEINKNLAVETNSINSVGLCDNELWIGAGGADVCGNKIISFALVFKYLTSAERKIVIEACERYLLSYSNNLHNYQTTTYFNVITEGHSFITPKSTLTDCIKGRINTLTNFDSGVSGSAIADCVSRQATLDNNLIVETTTYKNLLVLSIGVNNINNTGGQGTTAYNALKAYVQSRITAGHNKIFVYTITPTTAGGRSVAFEAERNTFNGLLRSDLTSLNGVYILDTDVISQLGIPSNTKYYVDALHPTYTGSILMGLLFSNKIAQLYGGNEETIPSGLDTEKIAVGWKGATLATYWNALQEANWSSDGTKLTTTATGGQLCRWSFWIVNHFYKIIVTVTRTSGAGELLFYSNNFGANPPQLVTVSGTYTLYFKNTASVGLYVQNTNGWAGDITAISIKEIL